MSLPKLHRPGATTPIRWTRHHHRNSWNCRRFFGSFNRCTATSRTGRTGAAGGAKGFLIGYATPREILRRGLSNLQLGQALPRAGQEGAAGCAYGHRLERGEGNLVPMLNVQRRNTVLANDMSSVLVGSHPSHMHMQLSLDAGNAGIPRSGLREKIMDTHWLEIFAYCSLTRLWPLFSLGLSCPLLPRKSSRSDFFQ